jgi:hypothetical protein
MADVVNGRGDSAAKSRLLGRVLSPLEIKELTSLLPGEEAMRHDEYLGDSPQDRFDEMGELIKGRLSEAYAKAAKHSSEGAGKWTPWMHRMNPSEMIVELRRREHLNERVIAHLVKELGIHMAMSVKIRHLIRQSQATMIDEAMDVPKGLQEFAIRLHAAGVRTASVKDLSKGAIDALTGLLNGEADPDLAEAVGLGKSARYVTDEHAARALEESGRIIAEHREAIEEEVVAGLPAVVEPVVPDEFGEAWDYSAGPLPPEYWSTVQELPIPYVWEYRMATPEEEERILSMPLPEAHDWAALRSWNKNFHDIATETIKSRKGAVLFMQDLFSVQYSTAPDEVDMNTVKAWLLLLAGRFMTREACDALFGIGYFDGVTMPCLATGPGVVRQLVPKGV